MKYFLVYLIIFSFRLLARDVIDESGTCQINWTQGHITCAGESEMGQSKYAATLVSKVVSQRNLLEVIKGVKIDSITTVQDGLMSSDIIQSRVQGMIKGAQIISNEYHKGEGYATAKARIYMGKDLLSALLSDSTKLSWNEKVSGVFKNFSLINSAYASSYSTKDKETLNKILQDLKEQGNTKAVHFVENAMKSINDTAYSGILIDISEVADFEKAMIVKLVDEDGKELYPAQKISKKSLTKKNTSVGYMFGLDDARKNKRIYSVPLEIKVQKIYKNKKSNIVLSASQVAGVQALDANVFANAKIILVLGE